MDDLGDYRPGLKALSELGIRSPLREADLTKADIRALSRELDLPTWNKPSFACLATRIPTGEVITAEKLQKVERAETALTALGLRDFRVRLLGSAARLQVTPADLDNVRTHRAAILAALKQEFQAVLLDLEVRK